MSGKVATLNRFVSRATDKCMPFSKVLKKVFQWTDECDRSPCKIKRVLDEATIAKSLSDGRKVVPLLSSVYHRSKFDID